MKPSEVTTLSNSLSHHVRTRRRPCFWSLGPFVRLQNAPSPSVLFPTPKHTTGSENWANAAWSATRRIACSISPAALKLHFPLSQSEQFLTTFAMAADVVALPVVNGIHAPSASDLAEYEKLIKLRDSVFSGQHPKLKLSSSSATQDSTQSAAANAQAITSNSAVNATFNLSNANGAVNQPNLLPPPQPNGQLMPAVPLPGFDPALLEKSPLLIATESNISRKSLEDAIQQEVKRRQTTWPKLDRENILPAFDVDDILLVVCEAEIHDIALACPLIWLPA